MKRTLLRTCVIAVSTISLTALSTQAQEPAGYATLSGRAPRRTVDPSVQPVTFAKATQGCTDSGCGSEGCVGAAPTANGCQTGQCQTGQCQTGQCQTGQCQTGQCQTGQCQTGQCQTGQCGPNGYAPAGSGFGANNCDNGMCNTSQGGYRQGFDQRVNSMMGRQNAWSQRGGVKGYWSRSSAAYQARNAALSQKMFGWMVPAGNGGQGAPPIGAYHMVYAQNANHFDQRDGGVYGAQGYGTHITVPLAPNVQHAYNYGWGMPSSRITHVSNVAPYTLPRPLHW